MTKQELIDLLDGTEFYVKERHYSKLTKSYVLVEYPVIIYDTTSIVEHIPWRNRTIEEILNLATEYLNLWLLI